MIDIVGVGEGSGGDIRTYDAQTSKAANLLSVQIGALEYAQAFGIDLVFFIQEDFQFQNDSFKSYLIQRLAENNINVQSLTSTREALDERLLFIVGDADQGTGGFIR